MPMHFSSQFIRFFVMKLLTVVVCALPCCASVLATFPAPTTLENIAVSNSGNIFTSALNTGTVYQVTPTGASQVFGQAGASATGLSFFDGSLFAVGGSNVYRFGPQGGTAAVVTN